MERADPAPRRVLRRLRLRLHHPGDIPRRDGARRIPGSRGVRMVVAPLRRRRRGEHLRGRRFARGPRGSPTVDRAPPAEDSMTGSRPPLEEAKMKDSQKKAAAALIAGPRKAVVGPFIALLRSPELLERLQRVGEYLRFDNTIPQRLNELAILSVARHVRNDFEWGIHHPLALKAGVPRPTLDALEPAHRPPSLPPQR